MALVQAEDFADCFVFVEGGLFAVAGHRPRLKGGRPRRGGCCKGKKCLIIRRNAFYNNGVLCPSLDNIKGDLKYSAIFGDGGGFQVTHNIYSILIEEGKYAHEMCPHHRIDLRFSSAGNGGPVFRTLVSLQDKTLLGCFPILII